MRATPLKHLRTILLASALLASGTGVACAQNGYGYALGGRTMDGAFSRRLGAGSLMNRAAGRFSAKEMEPEPPGSGSTLAAWVLSWWSLLLVALAGLGVAVIWLQWRIRALFKRSAALEQRMDASAREAEQARQALQQASLMDPLTGLHNRHFLDLSLPTDLQQARRSFGDMVALGRDPLEAREDLLLYLMDIDYFKQVNDTWGRPAGDAVLCQLARALKGITRKTDFRVRWDESKFLVVARRARRDGAPTVARNLLAAIRDLTLELPSGDKIRKRASIGYTAMPFHPAHPDLGTWQQAMAMAEQCLRAAKRTGRDRWVGAILKADKDPAPLKDMEVWDVAWALERELVDVQCSEPGFAWPATL